MVYYSRLFNYRITPVSMDISRVSLLTFSQYFCVISSRPLSHIHKPCTASIQLFDFPSEFMWSQFCLACGLHLWQQLLFEINTSQKSECSFMLHLTSAAWTLTSFKKIYPGEDQHAEILLQTIGTVSLAWLYSLEFLRYEKEIYQSELCVQRCVFILHVMIRLLRAKEL